MQRRNVLTVVIFGITSCIAISTHAFTHEPLFLPSGHEEAATQTPVVTAAPPSCQCNHMPPTPPPQASLIARLLKRYSLSLATGAAIGTCIGAPCAFIDANFALLSTPFTWYFSRGIRKAVVGSVSDTMKEEGVAHCQYTLKESAWVASWISWLATLGLLSHLNRTEPFMVNHTLTSLETRTSPL